VAAGFVGSVMLGLLVVASAILELTVALGCCCGWEEEEMTSTAEEGDRGSVGCCPLIGEGDEEGNEGCRVFTSSTVMVSERWEMVALVL